MDTLDIIGIAVGSMGFISYIIAFRKEIFNQGSKDKSLDDRICTLEGNYTKISNDINTIKDNHLAHIQTDINTINLNLKEINTTLKFITKEK